MSEVIHSLDKTAGFGFCVSCILSGRILTVFETMPKIKIISGYLLNVDLMIKVRSATRTDLKRDIAVKRLVRHNKCIPTTFLYRTELISYFLVSL